MVIKAMPEGGKVALFIGDNQRNNARLRLQGFFHGLLGSGDVTDIDDGPLEQSGIGDKYSIVETYIDDRDRTKAEENAKQAITDFPDLDGMMCLYGYNAPACLRALEEMEKLGEIKVVAFEDYEATLDGIEAGHIYGTVAQDPFVYGYESVRILAGLHRGEIAKAPPMARRSTLSIPAIVVTKENLAQHRKMMGARLSQTGTTSPSPHTK